MIRQTNIFDYIKTPYEQMQEESFKYFKNIDEWAEKYQVENDYSFNRKVKLVHYSNICKGWQYSLARVNVIEPYKTGVIELAQSFTYHFTNMNKDVYIGSFKLNDEYFRVFQVKERILVQTYSVKNITDDIYFPAMTIKMFDLKGNEIDFNNREDFIMNDLGFEKIGVIREKIFKNNRDFATLKSTWQDLINYLQGS